MSPVERTADEYNKARWNLAKFISDINTAEVDYLLLRCFDTLLAHHNAVEAGKPKKGKGGDVWKRVKC